MRLGLFQNRSDGTGRARRGLPRAALVALAAWPLVAWVAARALVVSEPLPVADAVVVLAGSAAYVERAAEAARLFREGRARAVVLTNDDLRGGWSSAEQRNPFFVERAAEELRRAGVPAERIEIAWRPVASTYDEALLMREHAAARGYRSLAVVTSGYHSRRALWTFRRALAGTNVTVGVEPAAPGGQTPAPSLWWLSAGGWESVAGEYVKLLYYRARYF